MGGVIPINIIGKSIRTHRKRAGLTQQKLSGQICVHEMTIRRWESGLREPRSSDIKALCEVLQVSESELLNGPKVSELKINIIWEVDGEMNELAIKANEFSVGLRSDGQYLFWGALPQSMTIDEIMERIRKELTTLAEMKELREKRLKG